MSHTGVKMNIISLTNKIKSNYFDYQKLSHALDRSTHVRREIGKLIRDKYIIRVKKGLYIWSRDLRKSPYSKEILSNLIYGPSYVSLEYALSFHGLIPERVSILTAVTSQRKKFFETPVGGFEYCHTYEQAYPWGVQRFVNDLGEGFLLACAEKALLDYIALRVKKWGDSVNYEEFLYDDLRIDEDEVINLDKEKINQLSKYYRSKAVKDFSEWFIKE